MPVGRQSHRVIFRCSTFYEAVAQRAIYENFVIDQSPSEQQIDEKYNNNNKKHHPIVNCVHVMHTSLLVWYLFA